MNAKKTLSKRHGLITDLDLSAYTGNPGEIIRTKTRHGHDDYAVLIVIHDVLSLVVEEGFATWEPATGSWAYRTTAQAPDGEPWTLCATSINSGMTSTVKIVVVPSNLRLPTASRADSSARDSAFGRWHRN